MSNIGEILKGIEKNKITLKAGTEFYYAFRNPKKPVKFAKRKDINEVFGCYDGFGCYSLDNYDNAYVDAQNQEDRIIY
ncbi:MAG: hypothetical protein SPH41_01270 [Bacilli bacterium]|nr:hypothetical protein [Bacilli bacterium]MDY5455974.1 hypothetical protein [Bacilli bacterium]MDY5937959.1 hypothetical protein [Bacilli bacterium]MDY6048404.1 hypothetical protein [Bacilli bacterium]